MNDELKDISELRRYKASLYSELTGFEKEYASKYLLKKAAHPDKGSEFAKQLGIRRFLFRIPVISAALADLGMKYFLKRGYDALILKQYGEIIGYTAFQIHDDKSLHIFAIEVDELHQGKHYSTDMQDVIIQKARQKEIKMFRISGGGNEATNGICQYVTARAEEKGVTPVGDGWFKIQY